jgi:hypothetical protein
VPSFISNLSKRILAEATGCRYRRIALAAVAFSGFSAPAAMTSLLDVATFFLRRCRSHITVPVTTNTPPSGWERVTPSGVVQA